MIELPKKPNKPTQNEFLFKRDIESSKVSKIMQAINYGWASSGACLGTIDLSWSTTSTSYVTANSGAGRDLDQINPMVSPRRKEIGALAQTDGAYIVEFQVFGRDVDLECSLYRADTGGFGAKPSAAATDLANLSFDTSWEWKSVFVLFEGVPTFQNTEHLLKFRGRYAQNGMGQGDIKQVAVNEIRYANTAYDQKDSLWLYGSEYINPYADGQDVDDWDVDGAELDLVAIEGTPTMVRDGVATNVHSVAFDGSSSLGSDPFYLEEPAGLLGAMAVKVDSAAGTGARYAMTKRGASAWSFFVAHDSSSLVFYLKTTNGSGSDIFDAVGTGQVPSDTWIDLVFWWDRSTSLLTLFKDGVQVDVEITPVGYELADANHPFYVGQYYVSNNHWMGELAMPTVLTGSFTRRQVEHFIQWRRSQHGIY